MPGNLQNRRKQKILSFCLDSKEKEDSADLSIPSLLLSKLIFEKYPLFPWGETRSGYREARSVLISTLHMEENKRSEEELPSLCFEYKPQ